MLTLRTVHARHPDAIQRLSDSIRRYGGEIGLTDMQLDMRHVTGYGGTLVFDVRLKSANRSMRFFAKVGADLSERDRSLIEKEATATQKIYSRFPASEHIGVVEPLFYSSEDAVFATKPINGERLDHLLARGLRFPTKSRIAYLETAISRCAEWLDAFRSSGDVPAKYCKNSLLTGAHRQLARLTDENRYESISSSFIELIADTLYWYAEQLESDALRPVLRHDDFGPWNIFCERERVVVFDFCNVQPGSIYYDVCYFDQALARLGERPMINKRLTDKLRLHFFTAIGASAPKQLMAQRFFEFYFCLERLGSFVCKDTSAFPASLLRRIRLQREIDRMQRLCTR